MAKSITCLSCFIDLITKAMNRAIKIKGKYNQRKATRDKEALGIMLRTGNKANKKAVAEKATILYFFLNRIIKIVTAINNIIEAISAKLAGSAG